MSYRCTREVGGWKNDELKGKNIENKGVLVFGGLSFRNNTPLCGVILEVESDDNHVLLKGHKNVLCTTSPFFYNSLNTEMKEKEEGVSMIKRYKQSFDGTSSGVFVHRTC